MNHYQAASGIALDTVVDTAPAKLYLGDKRIVVMLKYCGRHSPLSVHDTLYAAVEDIGKHAAYYLMGSYLTADHALYLEVIDR